MSELIKPEEFIQLPKKPVPLIESFLIALNDIDIFFTKYDFDEIILGSNYNDIRGRYYRSLVVREAGDNSGILGPLIGVSTSKKQTRAIIEHTGKILNQELEETGRMKKIIGVLDGEKYPDITDLKIINHLAGTAINHIKALAQITGLAMPGSTMTPEAYQFRERNVKATEKLASQFGGINKLLQREAEYDIFSKNLINIYQAPIIPIIDAPQLLEILPDELNRKINKQTPPASDVLGLFSKLNMAGSDIARYWTELAQVKLGNRKLEQAFH